MTRQRRNDLQKLDVYRCALKLYRAVGQIVAGFPRGEADFRSQIQHRRRRWQTGSRASCRLRGRPGRNQGADRRARLRGDRWPGATEEVVAAQDLADRVAAMLTKLIRNAEAEQR